MTFGYPARAVVERGTYLRLHVSTNHKSFHVRMYRVGAHTERAELTQTRFSGKFAPPRSSGERWQWPEYEIRIARALRPGAYVAVIATDGDANGALDARSSRALFVVRDAQPRERLLVVLPLFTYHAYNVAHVDGTAGTEEGDCLYSGAKWVTLHRPGGGVGGHPWDEVNADVYDRASPRQTFAHWDAKAIAWLERSGYAFDICTDLELHDGSVDLSHYAALASFGHHEYWTHAMRDRAEAFAAAGGNVAFFGGNTCWFEAEYDAAECALRRAGRWIANPEWRFTGVSYAFGGGKWIGSRPPSGVYVRNAQHWIFAGLPVQDGDALGFDERLAGYECDGFAPQSDLQLLADGSIAHWPVEGGCGERSATSRVSLGVREPGGCIFTASTADWARVLHAGNAAVEAMTHNVLRRFLSRP